MADIDVVDPDIKLRHKRLRADSVLALLTLQQAVAVKAPGARQAS